MPHYVCTGSCHGQSSEMGICEADGCTSQWEMRTECDCADNLHGVHNQVCVKDSNGNILSDGDTVSLIKDLPLKRSSTVLKRGTKVTNIKLTDTPEEIDCRIEGTAIVLRTEFLKKL